MVSHLYTRHTLILCSSYIRYYMVCTPPHKHTHTHTPQYTHTWLQSLLLSRDSLATTTRIWVSNFTWVLLHEKRTHKRQLHHANICFVLKSIIYICVCRLFCPLPVLHCIRTHRDHICALKCVYAAYTSLNYNIHSCCWIYAIIIYCIEDLFVYVYKYRKDGE